MPEAMDGDRAEYETCTDPDCADVRPGRGHAHLVKVEGLRNGEPFTWERDVNPDG